MIFGDTHIYSDDKADHVEAMKKQIKRKSHTYRFPKFTVNKSLRTLDDLDNLNASDLIVENYVCHSGIKAKMVA